MDHDALLSLCSHSNQPIPSVRKIPRYAHLSRAGKIGYQTTVDLYGHIPKNELYRKSQWEKWWQSCKQNKKLPRHLQAKTVHKPNKSALLAEFLGIMIGDGSLTSYQAAITLHINDDYEYSKFVCSLIQSLFHIKPNVYERPKYSTRTISMSRKMIVEYLHEIGLPIGNKVSQKITVPKWILADKDYMAACIRGLMDTDGSVFNHCYQSKGQRYCYKKISFTSASESLRNNMAHMLNTCGIPARISGKNLWIDSVSSVQKYFDTIGSHNSKHLKRRAK